MICRFGGDEFVIIVEELTHFDTLQKVMEKIRRIFEKSFFIDGHHLEVGMSIGAAVYPDDGGDAQTLLNRANEAMYRAKKNGKNQICYYQTRSDALLYDPLCYLKFCVINASIVR